MFTLVVCACACVCVRACVCARACALCVWGSLHATSRANPNKDNQAGSLAALWAECLSHYGTLGGDGCHGGGDYDGCHLTVLSAGVGHTCFLRAPPLPLVRRLCVLPAPWRLGRLRAIRPPRKASSEVDLLRHARSQSPESTLR